MKNHIKTALKTIEESRKTSGSAAAREVAAAFGTYFEIVDGEKFDDKEYIDAASAVIGDDPPKGAEIPYQYVEEAMMIIAACYVHQGFQTGANVGTGITSLFLRIQPSFDVNKFRDETMALVVDARQKESQKNPEVLN